MTKRMRDLMVLGVYLPSLLIFYNNCAKSFDSKNSLSSLSEETQGGAEETPPGEVPPVETPPGEVPPVEMPPGEVPPSGESPTTSPSGTVIKTADLGWTPGEDVASKLKGLLSTVVSGDEIIIGHMYKLSAEDIQLPDDLIISGTTGAGFSLINTMTATKRFLKFGSRNTIYNLTIKDELPLASEQAVLSNNRHALEINNKSDVKFVNTYMGTNAKINIRIFGSQRLSFVGVHFQYSYYQMYISAPSKNVRIEKSLFSDGYGDGIKTARAGGLGTENFLVDETVFENLERDGIDTTGGFANSTVTNSIFRNNNVSGLDLKNIYEFPKDMELKGRGNHNIIIENCEFININNAIVLTTIDRLDPKYINDTNHKNYLPNNILIKNSIVENYGSSSRRFILSKDAFDIRWENVQFLGSIVESRIEGLRDYPNLSHHRERPILSRTNYDIGGTSTVGPVRPGSLNNYPFSNVGPQ